MNKTKILILGYYLPAYKVGGPLVSILNIVKNLSTVYDFKILTPDRDFSETTPYPNIKTRKWINLDGVLVNYIPISKLTPFLLIKEINKVIDNSTIVYVNSVFNFQFSICIVLAKKLRFANIQNLVISPRGELFDEALGFKNRKKTLFLTFAKAINLYKNVIWHATTENEKKFIISKLNINPDKIRIALIMASTSDNHKSILSDYQLPLHPLRIVFLARISKDKNIAYALEILKKIDIEIVFDIYGAIEDPQLWEECQPIISSLPSNIKVSYLGVIPREIVKPTLSTYNLFLLPTFAENFGHSIAESLSVGTPVLISDNTPWQDLEKDGLGWDINLSNPELFIKAIYTVNNYTLEERKIKRKEIKEIMNIRLNDPNIINANKNLFLLPFPK
jgi:glycosyltransferase involved in cell wall biosynthesis